MRSSETFALTWAHVNLEAGTVSINKSWNMGATAATKTANSERIIPLDARLIEALKLLPSRELGLEHVCVGKRGEPMSKKMGRAQLGGAVKKAGHAAPEIYACRHTTITSL
jgi:integrase